MQLVESGEVEPHTEGRMYCFQSNLMRKKGFYRVARESTGRPLLRKKPLLSSQLRKGKWLRFQEMENSHAWTNTTQPAVLESCLLSMPKVRAPRNVKIRSFQKQKAIRLEFPTSVRLEGIRPSCPRLLWIGSSRNPANSSSTSQMPGFCWGSLSSSRLQQQHLASHMSTEVHINERVTTQLEHW